MDGIRILLFPAFVQGTGAQITEPSIDFYFTHEAVLEQGGATATAQWTTRCLAGGEFADVARGYAPDPRMSADERKAQAAKFDRREFVRIATALADYMVLEGRADYFAGTLFTHPAPWTAALDATAYATAWRALSKELNTTEWPTLQAAMFGSPQAGIPAWAGYSIGYRLVSERMARAPKLDIKAMTAAPASEFIPPLSR